MRPFVWQRLHWPIGNNAFAYTQRTRIDPHPQLRLPEIESINHVDQIQLGTFPTFAEFDENENIITYTWLKHMYHIKQISPYTSYDIPIYIFDNHNYALYFWATQFAKNIHPAPVIHIDQHADLAVPQTALSTNIDRHNDLATIAHYTTHVCNVGNFIYPARESWIISECIWIKNEYTLDTMFHELTSKSSYILDIDLDFWAPEMWTNHHTTIPLVQQLIKKASLVTIASSPYFLDQHLALQLLSCLFQDI